MKKYSIYLATFTFAALATLSCKKEGCTDSSATNYNADAKKDDGTCVYATDTATNKAPQPGTYTPSYNGTFATLVGIKTISTTSTPIGSVDTEIGTAVAVFSDNGGTSFLDAGTVSINSNDLSIQSNNSYVFTPSQSQPTGLSLSGNVSWSGTGNGWPSFSGSTSQDFSNVSEISTSDISTGTNYTLTCAGISNADSVYFGIYGPDGSAYFIAAGGTTSHTFSTADVNSIGSGQGYIQVVGLNYDPQSIGGRAYWFINETVRTKSVDIQ